LETDDGDRTAFSASAFRGTSSLEIVQAVVGSSLARNHLEFWRKAKQRFICLLTRGLAVKVCQAKYTSLATLCLGVEQTCFANGSTVAATVAVVTVVATVAASIERHSQNWSQSKEHGNKMHVDNAKSSVGFGKVSCLVPPEDRR
jgi:glycerol-3-phosphate dehydrogenase